MVQRRIVMFVGFTALIVLLAGCAAQSPGAGSRVSDRVTAAAMTTELTGIWHGSFGIVGGDASRHGNLALEIKDDGTYRLVWTRNNGVTSNDSGVVVAKADRVILNSVGGRSITLMRKGDTLYGLSRDESAQDSYPVLVTVERVPTTASDSDSRGSGSPPLTPNPERSPILDPIQTP